jgi:hypothetical protein
MRRAIALRIFYEALVKDGTGTSNIYIPTCSCHRQVIDLMRTWRGNRLATIFDKQGDAVTMFAMGRVCKLSAWLSLSLCLMVAFTGCSRSANFHRSDADASNDPNLPFHQDAGADSAPELHTNPDSGVPFNSSTKNLPAGTLLTVRLEDTLSTAKLNSDKNFVARLDAPVTVAGSIILPQGTIVHGRVESARASKVKQNTGYLRLTLESLTMDGKEVPVKTSSLFATGSMSSDAESTAVEASNNSGQDTHAKVILLTKGHRLTFRLTAALTLRPAPVRNTANLLSVSE